MKKIIIFCLIGMLVSSMVFAQNQNEQKRIVLKFSLTSKYSSGPININPAFPEIKFFIANKYSESKRTTKKETDWPFIILATSYITLSALDLHTTYEGLSLGAKETNPFMAPIIHNKPLAITVKMGSAFLATYSFYKLKKKNKTATYIFFGAITLVQGYVVYHNYKVIKDLKK